MVKHIVRSYAYIYSEMSEKNKKETPIDWFIDWLIEKQVLTMMFCWVELIKLTFF